MLVRCLKAGFAQEGFCSVVDLLRFDVADHRGALFLDDVVEVVRAMTITPLPSSPGVVEGVIDLRGTILPVVNLRPRLGADMRDLAVTDRFIVVRAERRSIALRVDEADEVVLIAKAEIDEAMQDLGDRGMLAGAARLPDGVVLIFDIDAFLTATEHDALDAALASGS
jgi:purine-binding chemotaxis protein CheW